jgi:hypothetical protein
MKRPRKRFHGRYQPTARAALNYPRRPACRPGLAVGSESSLKLPKTSYLHLSVALLLVSEAVFTLRNQSASQHVLSASGTWPDQGKRGRRSVVCSFGKLPASGVTRS